MRGVHRKRPRRRNTTEESAGSASCPTDDDEMIEPEVTETDFRRGNMCAEPFVKRRARRQEHGHECWGSECDSSLVSTHTSLMRPRVHGTSAPLLRRLPRQRNWQSICNESNWTDRATFHFPFQYFSHPCLRQTRATSICYTYSQRSTRCPSRRQFNGSREDWNRRYAVVRVQAFGLAMRAAKAKTAAQTQRL